MIVNSILVMGRGLNLVTAAEGIEIQAQLDVLKELGCQYGRDIISDRQYPQLNSSENS